MGSAGSSLRRLLGLVQFGLCGDINVTGPGANGWFGLPTGSYAVSGWYFGDARNPSHIGLDYRCRLGDAIYASDNGVVVFAGWSGGYGNLVKVDHGNGFVTYYAHLDSIWGAVARRSIKEVWWGLAVRRAGRRDRTSTTRFAKTASHKIRSFMSPDVNSEFDVPHSERSWRGGFLTHAIAVCTVTVWGWNGDRIDGSGPCERGLVHMWP